MDYPPELRSAVLVASRSMLGTVVAQNREEKQAVVLLSDHSLVRVGWDDLVSAEGEA